MSRHLGRLFFAVLFVLGAGVPVYGQSIPWRHDYAAARLEAQQHGKPMLLDFGTKQCYWCVQLDQKTFSQPSVQKLLSEQFIPVKIDADQQSGLTRQLGIKSYPTLIFAGADGQILNRREGFMEAGAMMQSLQQALANMPKRTEPIVATKPMPRPTEPMDVKPSLSPVMLSSAPPVPSNNERLQWARELLDQAKEAFQANQFAGCLERCAELTDRFADLPESAEARRLIQAVQQHAESIRAASESIARKYLDQADTLLKQKQTRQAEACLQRVVQAFPEAACAANAREQLGRLRTALEATPKVRAQSP